MLSHLESCQTECHMSTQLKQEVFNLHWFPYFSTRKLDYHANTGSRLMSVKGPQRQSKCSHKSQRPFSASFPTDVLYGSHVPSLVLANTGGLTYVHKRLTRVLLRGYETLRKYSILINCDWLRGSSMEGTNVWAYLRGVPAKPAVAEINATRMLINTVWLINGSNYLLRKP